MSRLALVLPTAITAAALVAGCGSSSSSSTSAGASSSSSAPSAPASPSPAGGLRLAADKSGKLAFDKAELTAKAGTVTISMSNPSGIPHGIAVDGNGVDKDGKIVPHGGTSTVSLKLKPGKYSFYCPVAGHRQAGMQGTLIVR